MSRVLLLSALSALLVGFPAFLTKAAPRVLQFNGQNYVLLRDWAERWQFELQSLKKDEEFRLANRTTALLFKLNSQRAEINGITVFLSFPLIAHQGEPYIASKDIDYLLLPILRPSKTSDRIRTIALCPGHGGKDAGFQVGAEQEKKYTLLLAREVQKNLHEAGFKVVLVRNSDEFVSFEDRTQIAKRRHADLYVSLHYNSAGPQNPDVHGSEVYCFTLAGTHSTNGGSTDSGLAEPGSRNNDQNVLLAYQMQKSLLRNLGMADRGVRRARFVMLRLAQMPAVLIEAGFMSNPDEMRRIKDPLHRRRTAQAILEALLAYKRIVES